MARRTRLSLRQRLFLLTALALAPALGILAFNEVTLRQGRAAEVSAYALRLGELAYLEMQRVITGAAALMVAVASAPVVLGDDIPACNAYLGRLQRQLPQLSLLAVSDPAGVVRCASANGADDLRPETSNALRERLGKGIFAVGEYVRTSRGPALQLGSSILGETGELKGYVVAALSLDYLRQLLRQREFAQGSAMTVADRNGTIIAREPLSEQFVGTKIPESFRELVLADQPGVRQVLSQDGTERIIGYYPATRPIGLYVSAGISTAEAFAPINEATSRGLLLALGGGALALLLAWLFGRAFIRRPVDQLTGTIGRWRSGDVSARTRMRESEGELDAVGATLDSLLDELAVRQAAQQAAERHRDLLNAELDHRIKNLLATVQAIAMQTFRRAPNPSEAFPAFAGRLAVLANAHQVLMRRNWTSAGLTETVEAVIQPFDSEGRARFSVKGKDLRLHSKAALGLSLALHELATNAVKYGALSVPDGHVAVSWEVEGSGRFVLRWVETGGPPVSPPSRQGFGSRMIEQALGADLKAETRLAFEPTGVTCTIAAEAAEVVEPASGPASNGAQAEVARP